MKKCISKLFNNDFPNRVAWCVAFGAVAVVEILYIVRDIVFR